MQSPPSGATERETLLAPNPMVFVFCYQTANLGLRDNFLFYRPSAFFRFGGGGFSFFLGFLGMVG
jgi:hypothetical protein